MDFHKVFQNKRAVDFAVILIFGTIPFIATGWNGFINPIDQDHPFFVLDFVKSLFYIWNGSMGFGLDASFSFSHFLPYVLPLAFLNIFFSPELAQRIFFIFFFSLGGWSMYYLLSQLLVHRYSRWACLSSALFYMYNPYSINGILRHGFPYAVLSIVSLPLLLGLYIAGLKSKKNAFAYAVAIGLVSLLQVTVNPQWTINQMFILLFFLVFYLLSQNSRDERKKALKFTATCIVLALIVNSFWELPLLASLDYHLKFHTASINFTQILEKHSMMYPPSGVVRQWVQGFYYEDYYQSNASIVVGFFLVVIAFSALLFMYTPYTLFFSLSSVIFFFLTLGINSPLRGIYKFIFNLPYGIAIFPYEPLNFIRFFVLCMAVLLGFSVAGVSDFIRSRFENPLLTKIFFVGVVLLILANSWPMLTGDLTGNIKPVEIPKDYYSARTFLSRQKEDFRVFVTPPPHWFVYTKYSWAPYAMVDVSFSFLERPVVADLPTSGIDEMQIIRLYESSLYQNRSPRLGKLLALMNIKYVLFRRDVDIGGMGRSRQYDPEILFNSLRSQENLELEENFGNLYFFKNEWYAPKIYATTRFLMVNKTEELLSFIESRDFIPQDQVILGNYARHPPKIPPVENSVFISYKKISPTHYVVTVNATSPFYLVFNENFHGYWKAYITEKNRILGVPEVFWAQSISEEDHYPVNTYANAWFIDKTGSYTLNLYYFPQALYVVGILVSAAAVILCVVYLVFTSAFRHK
ncbi:hypothetical protein HY991_00930 [Candidatus Micrarchaeota archaeon]|nr:hypothetical protein [Candidatus Micrarchaeota archaeon]